MAKGKSGGAPKWRSAKTGRYVTPSYGNAQERFLSLWGRSCCVRGRPHHYARDAASGPPFRFSHLSISLRR